MTYHENKNVWGNYKDNYCILESRARGQEFVVSKNDIVIEWAKNLILNNNTFQCSDYEIKHNDKMSDIITSVQSNKKTEKCDLVDIIHKYDIELIKSHKNLFNFEADNVVSMTCFRNTTNEIFIVKFNLENLNKVMQFDNWKVEKNNDKVYANKGTNNTFLHRLIYGDCKGKKVIAKNGNYFDCRIENLYLKP